ncbi:MAG: 2-amino-4-hydroxy-6-hydroxymethyldihydropteridine diphosphokinase [Hyphomonadaceae bacterium]|nr:2-amino-4-hydroxy-6-hydroxymethyldihydropteridine diphosphokinase [Hyphomonadaceae bacterium]
MGADTSVDVTESGRALVAIGTNMPFEGLAGEALVLAALAHLEREGCQVLRVSACRTTTAWPDPADPPFTNAVALLHVGAMAAQDVLAALLRTERAFGRVRTGPNAPRTLDLDLLDLDGLVIEREGLILPHPRLHARRFVLEPLGEVAPAWRLPGDGRSAADLLLGLPD